MLSLSLSAFLFRIWLVLLVHMAMLGLVWHKSKGQTDQNEADFVELLHTSATDYKFLAVQDGSIGDLVTHSLTPSEIFDF